MRTFLLVIATCIAISFAADCNNPLLKAANNPLITSTDGILTTPITAPSPFSFCPRLASKQICCDSTAQDNILAAFKAKYSKFENGRKNQVRAMEKVVKDSEDNESSDADFQATAEEVVLDSSTRILTEEEQQLEETELAVKTLRFLQDKTKDSTKTTKTKRTKDQRSKDIAAKKTKLQEKNKERTKKAKETNQKLKKGQASCFKRVFKFAAGMMCLACDADYANVVSTAADGTIQVKIQSKSCDQLMKHCYKYLEAREEAGAETKNAIKAKKARKNKGSLETMISKLEACMDDETCSSTDKATKLAELQKKMSELAAQKATKEESKEIEGDANMVVKKPASCTSETNCKYICEDFVGVEGAKEEAVDMTKATDTSARRLASSSLVYGNTGYEADADTNSVGGATETYTTDAGFPEAISTGSNYFTSALMIAIMLINVMFA